MKFSIRQLLLVVLLCCLWFAAMARGKYLVGTAGISFFGWFSGITLLLVGLLLLRWCKFNNISRTAFILVIVCSSYPLVFPSQAWSNYSFHARTQQYNRKAKRLQAHLNKDPRFATITVDYDDSIYRKGDYILVSGSVETEQTKRDLEQAIRNFDLWYIEWRVTILRH